MWSQNRLQSGEHCRVLCPYSPTPMVSFLFCWFLFSKRMKVKILCVKCKGQNERCPLPASSSGIMGGLWVLLTWMHLGSPTLMLDYRRKEVRHHSPFPDYSPHPQLLLDLPHLPVHPNSHHFSNMYLVISLLFHISFYLFVCLCFVCAWVFCLLCSGPGCLCFQRKKSTGTHWCRSGYILLNGHHLRTCPVLDQSVTGISAPFWERAITTPLLLISTTNALDDKLYQFFLPILVV